MKPTLSRLAGQLCNQPAFQQFLGVPNATAAAIQLRYMCGVRSRRELDTNPRAARRFHEIRQRFAYGEAA